MADSSEFESICPYNDAEAVEALNKVANHPAVLAISEYLSLTSRSHSFGTLLRVCIILMSFRRL